MCAAVVPESAPLSTIQDAAENGVAEFVSIYYQSGHSIGGTWFALPAADE
jgi:hypothetical protein